MATIHVAAHKERNPKTGKMVMHKAYSYTTKGGSKKATPKKAKKSKKGKK